MARMANAETDTETWRKHVARWRASGQTVPEYCREHGLAVSAMKYRIRREAVAPTIRLARVKRMASTPIVAPAPAAAVVIEVGLARVRVERGVDEATLATVLAALGVRR